MKAWLFYSLAAAILALPVGWIAAGVLTALSHELLPAQIHRPLYVAGDHEIGAAVAAVTAFLSVLLLGIGKSLKASR